MKSFIKAVCAIALITAISFSFIACGGGGLFGTKDSPASDFVYEMNASRDGIVITGYKGPGGHVVIPAVIEGFPVVEFAAGIFGGFSDPFIYYSLKDAEGKKDSKRIKEINERIKKENVRAPILSVKFPDSITEIARTQFDSRGTTYITGDVFNGNQYLKAVKLPKNIKEIPNMFSNNTALSTIILPESFEIVGGSAFYGLPITSIVLPEGVKEIRDQAFRDCKKLTSVTIPNTIERIGEYAFEGCEELVTVNIPAKQIQYGSYEPDGGNNRWRIGRVMSWDPSSSNWNERAFAFCTKLSLTERKKIEDTGYTGTFVSPW